MLDTDAAGSAMVAAQMQHRHQRARYSDDQIPALSRNDVLDTVLSFVGVGDYYYVAGVCRNWRGKYMQLCKQETQEFRFNTSRESIVTTAAKLQLALDNGLLLDRLAHDESKLGAVVAKKSLEAIAVLTVARVYGLQWSTHLTQHAATYKKYELLDWLRRCGCPLNPDEIIDSAFDSDLEHLKQLYELFGPWSAQRLTSLWCSAASSDKLETIKWLREVGAVWPTCFYDSENTPWGACCSCRCVQWAIANGSTWGTWRCQALAQ
jgi:hypothetical protein